MNFIDSHLNEDQEPLLVTSTSAVLTGTYKNDDVIIKSFRPQDYAEHRITTDGKPAVPHEGGYRRSQAFYFEKDVKILHCLDNNSGEDRIVPVYYTCDPHKMKIIMERIRGDTFSAKFKEYGDDVSKKRFYQRRMLEHVAKFHEFVNRDEVREDLLSFSYNGKPLVALRGMDELKGRLAHQIRIFVCSFSEPFEQQYGKTEDSGRTWKQTKRNIDTFLGKQNYSVRDIVDTILVNHVSILYEDKDPFSSKSDLEDLINQRKISIVHGDFNPANVFYRKQGYGKIIDFDEMQLAHSALDVVHALYHSASSPTESRALDLLDQYIHNDDVSYMEPWDSLLPKVVETRFMRYLEIIASDGKKSIEDLQSMPWLENEDVESIRMKNFNLLTDKFIPSFLFLEGYEALSQVPRSKVSDQLRYFREFIDTVIKPAGTTKKSSMVKTFQRLQKSENGGSK